MNALLALHGFTGTPRSWHFLSAQKGQVLIVPTLLGHDGTEPPGASDFESELARLAALIPERAQLVGYSLGARLALGIALRFPERVSGLTLLSGHPGLPSEVERATRRASDAAWVEMLLTRGVPEFVAAWEALPLWASQGHVTPELRAKKRSERLSHNALGLAESLRRTGLAEMPDYSRELARVSVPVTLAAGALDLKFAAVAQLMARRLPRAEVVIVPGAGHDLLLERPQFIAELIGRGHPT